MCFFFVIHKYTSNLINFENNSFVLGYREADGLTALSIAAGKKHKPITEILASEFRQTLVYIFHYISYIFFFSSCLACPEVEVNKASSSGITPLLMVAEVGWPDILGYSITTWCGC